jgi:hypothetical protein
MTAPFNVKKVERVRCLSGKEYLPKYLIPKKNATLSYTLGNCPTFVS